MITKEEAHRLFEYKDGKLYWKKDSKKRSLSGKRAGSYRYDGYRRINISGKYYMEHRLIYLMFNGEVPRILDHKNKIRDDNRIENIAATTDEMNNRNMSTRSDNTSNIPGVHFYKRLNCYVSFINLENKCRNLGYSKCLVEAAAKRYAGEQCLGVPEYAETPAKLFLKNYLRKEDEPYKEACVVPFYNQH